MSHACVVTHDDGRRGKRLVAYVVPGRRSAPRDLAVERRRVAAWRDVSETAGATGPEFAGWNSTYDGTPIPLEQMSEWVSETVRRIRSLRPRRVLEIGVGTGLLLRRVAPDCETYWGTDIAGATVQALHDEVARTPGIAGRVRLLTRPANDLHELPAGYFDTIVLNSVVQYFPGAGYLDEVLGGLAGLLAPGGALFVGDVRHRLLLRCLRAAAESGHDGDDLARARGRIEQKLLTDPELSVEPEYFPAFGRTAPGITGVDVRVKRGSYHNELTRYRYDVVLHKGPARPLSLRGAPPVGWVAERWTPDSLADHLTTRRPPRLRITGVPNGRLSPDLAAMRAVAGAAAPGPAGPDVEELCRLGTSLGYAVYPTWSAGSAEGALDVVFVHGDTTAVTDVYLSGDHGATTSAYVHEPRDAGELAGLMTAVRDHLSDRLPKHLVPSAFVPLTHLPRTRNDKLDRNALPAPESSPAPSGRPPRTARERALASLFAEVLSVPSVGIDHNFFEIGGDSIVAIQLSSRCREEGIAVTPKDVFEHKSVARLAVIAGEVRADPAPVPADRTGPVPLTPIVHWLRGLDTTIDAFSQSMVVSTPAELDEAGLLRILQALVDCHDALRLQLAGNDWALSVRPVGTVSAAAHLRRVDVDGDHIASVADAELRAARDRLAPGTGTMAEFVWLAAGPDRLGRLVLVIHHLAVDGVSWRILLSDLARAWQAVARGEPPALEPVPTSLRSWAGFMVEESRRPERLGELLMWTSTLGRPDPPLGPRPLDPRVDVTATTRSLRVSLPTERTVPVLTSVPAAFHAGVHDVLVTAFVLAVARWRPSNHAVLVDLEGHGRDLGDADLSRTVGWFTNLHPARLDPGELDQDELWAGGPAAGVALKRIKEQLRALPDNGIGYGLLRHLNPDTGAALAHLPTPQLGFNYLGRFPAIAEAPWAQAPETGGVLGSGADPAMALVHSLDLNALTYDEPAGPRLVATWSWAEALLTRDDVAVLADLWFAALDVLVRHSGLPGAGGRTPSDLPLVSLSQAEIDWLEAMWKVTT